MDPSSSAFETELLNPFSRITISQSYISNKLNSCKCSRFEQRASFVRSNKISPSSFFPQMFKAPSPISDSEISQFAQ